MEIKLVGDDQITLPRDICSLKLTLAEIGAVVMLQCMQAQGANPTEALTQEFMPVMIALKDRGIISAVMNGKKLALTVDLEQAE